MPDTNIALRPRWVRWFRKLVIVWLVTAGFIGTNTALYDLGVQDGTSLFGAGLYAFIVYFIIRHWIDLVLAEPQRLLPRLLRSLAYTLLLYTVSGALILGFTWIYLETLSHGGLVLMVAIFFFKAVALGTIIPLVYLTVKNFKPWLKKCCHFLDYGALNLPNEKKEPAPVQPFLTQKIWLFCKIIIILLVIGVFITAGVYLHKSNVWDSWLFAQKPSVKWDKVANSERFREAPLEERNYIRDAYFLDNVVPYIHPDERQEVWKEFYQDTQPSVIGGHNSSSVKNHRIWK